MEANQTHANSLVERHQREQIERYAQPAIPAGVNRRRLRRQTPEMELVDPRTVPHPPTPPLEVVALSRMAFGMSPADRDWFNSLGANPDARLAAYIQAQLNPAGIDDSACEARLAANGFQTLGKSLEQLWADHVVNNETGWSYRILPLEETERATFIRAVYSRRQLVEVLADFWHNHFNVYGWHYYVSPVFVHYDRDVIRANLLGNFRQMLTAVAKSTAMLFYLDNYINQAGGFNENFARECIELHTLGAENYFGTADPFSVPLDDQGVPLGYVDNDVYEAARAFTGWRVDYSSWEPGVGESGTFLYYAQWHDRANKFFMRKYFPADQPALKDGNDVLDALAYHRGTARYVCRKLVRRLISDAPPNSVVEAAAQVFYDQRFAPDQLKQVTAAILNHPEFKLHWAEKIRRPFEASVAMLRAVQAEFNPSDEFFWWYDGMGQELFSRPSPDGYPDVKDSWNGTISMLERWNLANGMIESWIEGLSADVLSQMPGNVRTPNAIVDYWINRILGRMVHPAENRDFLVEFIADGRNPDFDLTNEQIVERTPRLVALILMTPDFQLR